MVKNKINITIENISNGYLYADDEILSINTKMYFGTRDALVNHIITKLKTIGII